MDAKLPQNTTVGFIGLGRMGNPMARNLRRGDYKVVGYDIRKEAVEALAGEGVAGARSVAEVGKRSDVVVTMVPDSRAVEEVALGPEGLIRHMARGKVLIDMSSSYPASTEQVGKALAERGIGMLGAPVSGGVAGAEAASLTIMVGGEEALFRACLPIFEALGKKEAIFYMGPLSAGHTMKIINNFLSALGVAATCEAVALAMRAGLDPRRVVEVLNQGTGRTWASMNKFPLHILPRAFASGFSLGLQHKDLQMCAQLARDQGVMALFANLTAQVLQHGVRLEGPDADHTRLARLFEDWMGVRFEG